MNENSKEPVVEQALDNIESNVSEKKMVTKSPSTSKKKDITRAKYKSK